MSDTAILLISCEDQRGIIAAVTTWLHGLEGNVVALEEHVDSEHQTFFMRVEWELDGFGLPFEAAGAQFHAELGERFGMEWTLHRNSVPLRMAVMVSKMPHCLLDILGRTQAGEWNAEIPLVISNHPDLEPLVTSFGIDYRVVPITKENKHEQEDAEIALLHEHRIDLVVLARYMQIVTPEFIGRFPNRIINIHHSFLPAFAGARPYHQAYERGVKIIGATSHYVTAELDAGPIIAQDVTHVSHVDAPGDMVRKGRDVEKIVLARAIRAHVERKVLVFGNRTVVFSS